MGRGFGLGLIQSTDLSPGITGGLKDRAKWAVSAVKGRLGVAEHQGSAHRHGPTTVVVIGQGHSGRQADGRDARDVDEGIWVPRQDLPGLDRVLVPLAVGQLQVGQGARPRRLFGVCGAQPNRLDQGLPLEELEAAPDPIQGHRLTLHTIIQEQRDLIRLPAAIAEHQDRVLPGLKQGHLLGLRVQDGHEATTALAMICGQQAGACRRFGLTVHGLSRGRQPSVIAERAQDVACLAPDLTRVIQTAGAVQYGSGLLPVAGHAVQDAQL